MAYTTLKAAQDFIDMPNGYSGILISINNDKRLDEIIKNITEKLSTTDNSNNYDVLSWHFTMERLLQQAGTDEAFGSVLMLILYIIVGFGILGTVIMMTNERKREFGMMISLGMPRIKLAATTVFELLVMSFAGVILALGVTLPTAYWFNIHPIQMTGDMATMLVEYGMEPVMPTAVETSIFTNQITIILIIVVIVVIYPIRKIMKLKITESKL